jgi:hypothetical protein
MLAQSMQGLILAVIDLQPHTIFVGHCDGETNHGWKVERKRAAARDGEKTAGEIIAKASERAFVSPQRAGTACLATDGCDHTGQSLTRSGYQSAIE